MRMCIAAGGAGGEGGHTGWPSTRPHAESRTLGTLQRHAWPRKRMRSGSSAEGDDDASTEPGDGRCGVPYDVPLRALSPSGSYVTDRADAYATTLTTSRWRVGYRYTKAVPVAER